MDENKTEQKELVNVPYFVYEAEIVRHNVTHEKAVNHLMQINKRLVALCLIIFIAFVLTNAGWVIYESQFEDVVVTQEATVDGDNEVMLNGRDIYYGGENPTDD